VNATGQFHIGIVVDDLDDALEDLGELFGYEWCPVLDIETPVVLPNREFSLHLHFTYSKSVPRVELIKSVAGTLWVPAPESGIHHAGYWSDDVAADGRLLAVRGYAEEAQGVGPDGNPIWSYHRSERGPRIELVSRQLEAGLASYWASG
jgi:hypothetical protein